MPMFTLILQLFYFYFMIKFMIISAWLYSTKKSIIYVMSITQETTTPFLKPNTIIYMIKTSLMLNNPVM